MVTDNCQLIAFSRQSIARQLAGCHHRLPIRAHRSISQTQNGRTCDFRTLRAAISPKSGAKEQVKSQNQFQSICDEAWELAILM